MYEIEQAEIMTVEGGDCWGWVAPVADGFAGGFAIAAAVSWWTGAGLAGFGAAAAGAKAINLMCKS